MKIIIQIPCYNEEKTLPEVFEDLPKQIPGVDHVEYLVINDGSTDKTLDVARKLGVHHILDLGTNHGLATAFQRGVAKCLELGANIIVNTDGDNQYRADCIKDLVKPIVEGRLDIVVGARPIKDIEHFSWMKKILQQLGSRVVRQFSDTNIPDATSGFRAYSAEAAMRLHVFNRYTYTLETIIQAGHMNMRIGHVPIQVNPKKRESRLISSITNYLWRSAAIIVRSYITYKPLRTFFYLSLIPAVFGLAICFRFLYYYLTGNGAGHIQSIILAMILLLLSFYLLVLGILADLLAVNRRLLEDMQFKIKKIEIKENGRSS